MKTNTPRTDAAQFIQHDMTAVVDANFARTLESELADEAIALRDMMSERDAAEAELATAKAIIASIEEDGTEEHNAAVNLRQELAAERARLDWLEGNAGDIPRYHSRSWIWIAHQNLREKIDAAMKEGAK